jgi:hypothetical protein
MPVVWRASSPHRTDITTKCMALFLTASLNKLYEDSILQNLDGPQISPAALSNTISVILRNVQVAAVSPISVESVELRGSRFAYIKDD